jgi:S-adenosylmethionine synthetase
MNFLFSSESVTEGHPDKIADQISDAILDACLQEDPKSRVACETFLTTGLVLIGGEITTHANVHFADVARRTIRDIGYDHSDKGFSADTCGIIVTLDKQSGDIAMGVDRLGAGDQGLMFGFACRETPEYMPFPIHLAHTLAKRLTQVRKDGTLPYLRPDGKSQVSVRYEQGQPVAIDTIVVSSQHAPEVDIETLRQDIQKEVIEAVVDPRYLHGETVYHINPTGRFVIGGPMGDAGLTGRKIIVDTYGGYARHGGGAFSGKDATKVDRSAAYAARYVAKNLVAAGLAEKLEIQLAYAIGIPEPVSIHVDTFGTGKASTQEIIAKVQKEFDLTPKGIIEALGLQQPLFQATAAYGHFGNQTFPWEQLDRVAALS